MKFSMQDAPPGVFQPKIITIAVETQAELNALHYIGKYGSGVTAFLVKTKMVGADYLNHLVAQSVYARFYGALLQHFAPIPKD